LLLLIFAAFIIEIIGAVFYMRAFNKLGEKSGVRSFNKAGMFYVIGTVLMIVAIGGLLFWIAWIYVASGFNSLKPKAAEPSNLSYSMPAPPPPSMA